MTAAWWRRRPGLALLGFALLACQENLTAPGDCPELCPGGSQEILEVVVPAIAGADTTFEGYVGRGQVPALLTSSGLPPAEHRALVRFVSRPDSVTFNSEQRTYTIDSVVITLRVASLDTTVTGAALGLYRMPVTIDSLTTFDEVEPLLVPANRFATIPVPDTTVAGDDLRLVLSGGALAGVAIPPADSGVLAFAAVVEAPVPTGVRLVALAGGAGAPSFVTYLTVTGEADAEQTIPRFPAFNGTVRSASEVDDPALLEVGGMPAARSYLRFELPPVIRDSATLVRATLELVPVEPLFGLPNNPANLLVYGVRADVGAKSPLCVINTRCGDVFVTRIASTPLPTDGSTDPVQVDILGVVRGWQGDDNAPTSLFLVLSPEGASFTRALFNSTRQPAGRPQLRINYVLPFGFERP